MYCTRQHARPINNKSISSSPAVLTETEDIQTYTYIYIYSPALHYCTECFPVFFWGVGAVRFRRHMCCVVYCTYSSSFPACFAILSPKPFHLARKWRQDL